MILGAGRIARALLRQLLAREEYLRQRYNLTLPVAAVASSRYLAAGAPYLGAKVRRPGGQIARAGHGGDGQREVVARTQVLLTGEELPQKSARDTARAQEK